MLIEIHGRLLHLRTCKLLMFLNFIRKWWWLKVNIPYNMYTYIHAWYLPIFRIFWAWFLCWMMLNVIYHTWILWEWYFRAMTTLQMMRYTWFVLLSRCFLDLFVRAPKFAPKKIRKRIYTCSQPIKMGRNWDVKVHFPPPKQVALSSCQ